ncbi:MAG: hypothetical protein ACOH1T_10170 [Microbacteriaceae bacterium]
MTRTTVTVGAVIAATVIALAGLPATAASAAPAFSDTDSVTLPGTTIKLQANAWSPNITKNGKVDFVTSSKTTKAGARFNVSTIKNTATVEARGINPSVSLPKGVSVGGASNSKSISWTNNKAWIADLSGRATYTGLTISLHVNSAAYAFHSGVKKYVDVWSW